MITPDYVKTFARYNRWQNQSLYDAAETLSDSERRQERGAFFGSIHGTLAHLMFGDGIWMSRFTSDDSFKPLAKSIPESPFAYPDWAALKAARTALDMRITAWSSGVSQADLDGDLTWYSGAMKATVTRPKALLITHFFNHQTHHRGQVHAMLTSAGARPDATDLMITPDTLPNS